MSHQNMGLPFHPFQSILDAHAAVAVTLAISRMGPKFQLLRWGYDQRGFFIDGLQHENVEPRWLEEVARSAIFFWKQPWGELETMMGENLREFWRYQGQKVRAREGLSGAVDVVAFEGARELAPSPYLKKRPMIDSIVLSVYELTSIRLKGHAEKGWRLEGRVLVDRAAKRAWSLIEKSKGKPTLDPALGSTVLETHELEKSLSFEQDLYKSLNNIPLRILKACDGTADLSKPALWWGGEHVDPIDRPVRLWNEKRKRSLSLRMKGSYEEIASTLIECLLSIRKIVNILGLEVEHHLVMPHATDPKPFVFLVAKGWMIEDLEQVNCHRSDSDDSIQWALWGYDASGAWWKLSQWEITRKGASSWRGSVDLVTSFERWLAMILQGGRSHVE